MNKKSTLPIIIFISIALGFFIGRIVYKSENIFYTQNKDFKNLKSLIEIVEENYSEDINVFDFLRNSLLNKLQTIDPYLSFYDVDEYNNVKNEILGEYNGIGISYFVYNDTVLITNVFKNSSADISGIKKLDRIIELNGDNITGLSLDSIVEIFSESDDFNISYLDFFTDKIHKASLEKSTVEINPIKYFYAGNNIGYIKINTFHSNTFKFFKEAEEDLKSKNKIDKIILDLRDNPGGLLTSAISILDEFFDKGDTLTTTETKKGEKETYISTSEGGLKNVDVIVLINGGTASAAELLSLAFQDNDRALFIGSKTYGKGVFQQDVPVKKGDVIHVTKGKYYGPSGRWIDTQDEKLFDFVFYKTKSGRYVAAQNAIVPEIYNSGNTEGYIYNIFDDYCLDFIIKDKPRFVKIKDPKELLAISEEIVKNKEIKAYTEYFENDSIMAKSLAFSFGKYLLSDSSYLHFVLDADSNFIKAMQIFTKSDVDKLIFEKDTLQPFTYLKQ